SSGESSASNEPLHRVSNLGGEYRMTKKRKSRTEWTQRGWAFLCSQLLDFDRGASPDDEAAEYSLCHTDIFRDRAYKKLSARARVLLADLMVPPQKPGPEFYGPDLAELTAALFELSRSGLLRCPYFRRRNTRAAGGDPLLRPAASPPRLHLVGGKDGRI